MAECVTTFKCANPDCSKVFAHQIARDAHVWPCTRPIFHARLKKVMIANGHMEEDGSGDDDDGPSYSSSASSSSSARAAKPAKVATPKKCRRCEGSRVMKYAAHTINRHNE